MLDSLPDKETSGDDVAYENFDNGIRAGQVYMFNKYPNGREIVAHTCELPFSTSREANREQ